MTTFAVFARHGDLNRQCDPRIAYRNRDSISLRLAKSHDASSVPDGAENLCHLGYLLCVSSFESSAALWRHLQVAGHIRPGSYDSDLVAAIRKSLGLPPRGDLETDLAAADVSITKLVSAMFAALEGFSALLADLMALYARIGARHGTGDSLRVQYEFSPGETLNLLLSEFKEEITVLRTHLATVESLETTPEHLWDFPFRDWLPNDPDPGLVDWVAKHEAGQWPESVPAFSSSGNETLDRRVAEVTNVLRTYLEGARRFGDARLAVQFPEQEGDPEERDEPAPGNSDLYRRTDTDNWLVLCGVGLHRQLSAISSDDERQDTANALGRWLSGIQFTSRTAEVQVQSLESILALPTWGKRHDLYAAWVLCDIDLALEGRLRYNVQNNTLRLPFRPTRVAELDSDQGPLELWSELRSAYDKPIGASRKSGVQPDYRFIAPGDPVNSPLAIEVKQYLRSIRKNPGEALADYTGALPKANVVVASHGPISGTVMSLVPVARRNRAFVVDMLQPNSLERATFRAVVKQSLPSPTVEVEADETHLVELMWAPHVSDLDIHAYVSELDEHIYFGKKHGSHAELDQDTRWGGPERLLISPSVASSDARMEVWVHVYSGESLEDARPIIRLHRDSGVMVVTPPDPLPSKPGLAWHAFSLIQGEASIAGRYAALPDEPWQ